MAKHKKYELILEQEYDFDMIGISSHHNDYRLAWNINSQLGLSLELSKEPFIVNASKKGESVLVEFNMYEFQDKENHLNYYLIKNKRNAPSKPLADADKKKSDGQLFLIPEKQSIDFFLFICEKGMVDVDEMTKKLRNVSSILAVFNFDPEELASAEKLVFN